MYQPTVPYFFFFLNNPPPPEISPLPLPAALPIDPPSPPAEDDDEPAGHWSRRHPAAAGWDEPLEDRKSTRLNSSHANISYAVFCLKKKKNKHIPYSLDRSYTR